MVFRRTSSEPRSLSGVRARPAVGMRRVQSAPASLDRALGGAASTATELNPLPCVVERMATESRDTVEDSVSDIVRDDLLLSALFHVLWRRAWSWKGWSADTFASIGVRFAVSVATHHLAGILISRATEARVCLESLPASYGLFH